MEKAHSDRRTFRFNENIENWEDRTKKVLEETDGTLFLINKETGEPVEAKIVFLYSTLIYSGFNCLGILRIGEDIGGADIDFTVNTRVVYFDRDNTLFDNASYNNRIKEIVEYLDDDCQNSEAIHAYGLYGIDGMKVLIKQYHAMQNRNNNPETPYTEHLHGVASILETIVENEKEISDDMLNIMIQAALGHDLLEDTAINEDTLERTVDDDVLLLINELTNPNDDAHTDEYMDKLAQASEEARLIKYADLIENTSSFCYSLHEANLDNPAQRAKEFYLPILTRTTDVLANTSFELYPKTAEAMQKTLKVYTNLLLSRIEMQ